MADDSLAPIQFKHMTVIAKHDPGVTGKYEEGEVLCGCGREFMYSIQYEENLRQINDSLVFRCPRCYAMSLEQTVGLLSKECSELV